MAAYRVEFLPEAVEELQDLDEVINDRILKKIKWFSEHFEVLSPDPLKGELEGLFKLRVGDYRVIYSFERKKELIVVHMVGHRRDIYNS